MSDSIQDIDAERLRNALVDGMLKYLPRLSPTVQAAFRSVGRDRFLPGVELSEAYTDNAFKRASRML